MRAVLERDEDMASIGTRHPLLGRYRAGVTADGTLTGVQLEIYLNGGFSHDLSLGVSEADGSVVEHQIGNK